MKIVQLMAIQKGFSAIIFRNRDYFTDTETGEVLSTRESKDIMEKGLLATFHKDGNSIMEDTFKVDYIYNQFARITGETIKGNNIELIVTARAIKINGVEIAMNI